MKLPWLKKTRISNQSIGQASSFKVPNRKGRVFVFTSIVVTGLVLGIKQIGAVQPLELIVYDWLVRSQPAPPSDSRLLIIEITEADIQAQQQWPLSDEVLANLLARLQTYKPAVIGLDLYRNLPNPPGYANLKQQLQAKNVITIENLGDLQSNRVPPPPTVPLNRVGFNDLVLDDDNVVRRNLLFADLGNRQVYSLALLLSLHYLGKNNITPTLQENYIQIGDIRFNRLKASAGGYQNVDNTGYQILLRYRAWHNIARSVSLTEALQGKIDPSWVKGKIVLIGTTALSQKDYFFTPFSTEQDQQMVLTGVMMHAQMTSQILSAVSGERALFRFWSQWGEALWVWLWSATGIILSLRFHRPERLMLINLGGLFSLSAVTYVLFTQAVWVPLVAPAFAFSAASTIAVVYKAFQRNFYDVITNLPNRRLLMKILHQELSDYRKHCCDSRRLAVLILDLDRFSTINENFGYAIGNQLLQNVAACLKAVLPPNSFLAKLEGDEFAIVLKQVDEVQDALTLADQLRASLAEPVLLPGIHEHKVIVSTGIGIALSQLDCNDSPEHLLQDAQTATYRAKSLGQGRHELFSSGMRTQSQNRFSLESDICQALERKEFELHYQPILCLKTQLVKGFEALVRWQHPSKGLVYPGEFISLVEENGLIVPLGYWILEEACRQMYQWHQLYSDFDPFFVSVNLSGRQFAESQLQKNIERILEKTQFDKNYLKLELTESVVMDNVESSVEVLLKLKSLGVNLGIDDFGTGYSSLSYLHRFPIDTLKVDRSFVMRIEDASENAEIVKTIIALGHNLGMSVVAEGIETAKQARFLRDLACEYGQGYFFSKPLPPGMVEAWLGARTH